MGEIPMFSPLEAGFHYASGALFKTPAASSATPGSIQNYKKKDSIVTIMIQEATGPRGECPLCGEVRPLFALFSCEQHELCAKCLLGLTWSWFSPTNAGSGPLEGQIGAYPLPVCPLCRSGLARVSDETLQRVSEALAETDLSDVLLAEEWAISFGELIEAVPLIDRSHNVSMLHATTRFGARRAAQRSSGTLDRELDNNVVVGPDADFAVAVRSIHRNPIEKRVWGYGRWIRTARVNLAGVTLNRARGGYCSVIVPTWYEGTEIYNYANCELRWHPSAHCWYFNHDMA
ncbi:hypothetical protein ACIQMR_37280 [Streptomyces sp. NPDC091376]|uniref:hypothetical protein n=1 Tax=Streptomyces sp. NPDC091376 TaxID=3365994 RepID=UPI00381108B0